VPRKQATPCDRSRPRHPREAPLSPFEQRFGVVFDDCFAGELQRLRELEGQGLVTADADAIRLTAPLGRLLVRVVAAVFDRYLPPDAFRNGLSAEAASRVG
jgi:coproporphyrinogen III oxidase-like Fe-S oxidoreductase